MMEEKITMSMVLADLKATLTVPEEALGIVLIPVNSGKLRLCDSLVTELFLKEKIGILTLDLLSTEEALETERRQNIELLTERLVKAVHLTEEHPATSSLPIGLYGSGEHAAPVLRTAAGLLHQIKAVVTVDGNVESVLPIVHSVTAPTLQIIDKDLEFSTTHEQVLDQLTVDKQLSFVQGLSSFHDPRRKVENDKAASEIASLAVLWFHKYLGISWINKNN